VQQGILCKSTELSTLFSGKTGHSETESGKDTILVTQI